MPSDAVQDTGKRGERFLGGVLWSWFGVGVSIFSGTLIAPITIHKLGPEGYGVWTVFQSFVDYFGLMDLGFRSATAKYTAHYRATGETDKVNEVLNSALLYATAVAALTMAATVLLAKRVAEFEHISSTYRNSFIILIAVVGIGFAVGVIFNQFTAAAEGFQRFDITTRIWIVTIAIRSFGVAGVLYAGYGLLAMGMVVLVSLIVTYLLSYLGLRLIFPALRLSFSLATAAMFRQMLNYGVHTFMAAISQMFLSQSAPLLIARFLPTAYAGYYGAALKLPYYSVDMVGRVGVISTSHAAEMAARNDLGGVARMGTYINRYCFMLFVPVTIAMIVYGKELLGVWLGPEYAAQSGPLLPVLAIGFALGIAAQYNSSSILYGLGKHQGYALSLAVEAGLCVPALYLVIPRYGILGAAWVVSVLMVLNRGLFASWLLSRAVHCGMLAYLRGIYVSPLLVGIPTALLAVWVKEHWLPGNALWQVICGGALLTMFYYAVGFFTCLEKEHRKIPLSWIRSRLGLSEA